jgi:hypothetical protein
VVVLGARRRVAVPLRVARVRVVERVLVERVVEPAGRPRRLVVGAEEARPSKLFTSASSCWNSSTRGFSSRSRPSICLRTSSTRLTGNLQKD